MKYLLLLLCVSASAKQVKHEPAKSDCRAVRILAIGGELQPNTWNDCGSGGTKGDSIRRHNEYKAKVDNERKEYKHKQDRDREDRKSKYDRECADRKRKQDGEREKRESDKKDHECRGIGSGANCTGENPGKGNDKAKAKKADGESNKKH